ncbi:MAG: conserved membrane protein of unknown function [Promethearchaeota archaeon]|nr:MAG: conserved membrane protein of unknown function [Candidatus Lokiarchaeota archaeon]
MNTRKEGIGGQDFNEKVPKRVNKRYLSIDVFKGLSIVLMVFVNSIQLFEKIPSWSKHAELYGLTYLDLIFPFFIFMMGLNLTLAYHKHKRKDGRVQTYKHFIKRFIIFILLGMMLSIGYDSDGIYLNWGVLQVLGACGLCLLFFIDLKWYIRIFPAVILIILYMFIIRPSFTQIIYEGIEGGLLGTISWVNLILLSSIMAEGLLKDEVEKFILFGSIAFVVLGLILSFLIAPLSRQLVTSSYIILTVGISGLVFYLIYYIFEIWGENKSFGNQENILSILGKNSFFLFIIHLLLISIGYEIFPLDLPVVFVLLLAGLNILIILVTGYLLYKADVIVKF